MDEIFRKVVITLRRMWHYRWLGLATTWVVGMVAVAIVMLIPDKYEATARIYVNTASILKPLMTGLTVQMNDDTRIAMLSRILISRPNVEKLVQAVGLDADIKSKQEYDRLLDRVSTALTIKGSSRDNLYSLTFRDTDSDRAKRAIQFLASLFIESGQGGKTGETDAAKKFIDEQVAVYEKKLQEAESRLKDFKVKNLGLAPGEGTGYFARLAETSALLSRAQLELREAENSRDAFRRGLESEGISAAGGASTPSVVGTGISDLDARIDAMKRNLDTLLLKYTEGHPDVVGAQRVIKDLEDQRRQLIEQRPKDSAPAFQANLNGPRASEQLKVSLASAEAAVASLRIRAAEYSSRYNQLKSVATQMPQLEAEFAQLNRDYDVNKKNYESLVSRRESASISGDMQSVSGVADFRLIDPPRVSPRPVAPNRNLLIPMTLLLAIGAGIAATIAAMELRPTFYDRKSLSDSVSLPILGTVSMVLSDLKAKNERKSTMLFVSGFSFLIIIYVAGFVAFTMLTARAA
jgi:polysaccharide chain length determinant protein (PEP-CTERM system associated)